MNWLLVVLMVAMIVVVLKCTFSGDKAGVIFGVVAVPLLLTGFILIDQNDVNDRYAAATRQHIVITTSLWQQQPIVIHPCRFRLEVDGDGSKTKLVLRGTDRLVTPQMLNAICGKEG